MECEKTLKIIYGSTYTVQDTTSWITCYYRDQNVWVSHSNLRTFIMS